MIAAAETIPRSTCAWRTGAYACTIPASSGHRCAWHGYWLRIVETGNIGRQQYEEFCEWWEQFQPYGQYAENHGPWWAAIEVLWTALTGMADPPMLTREIRSELLLRRAEVRHMKIGQPWTRDPWPRLSGTPLPVWEPAQWQRKIRPVSTEVA